MGTGDLLGKPNKLRGSSYLRWTSRKKEKDHKNIFRVWALTLWGQDFLQKKDVRFLTVQSAFWLP